MHTRDLRTHTYTGTPDLWTHYTYIIYSLTFYRSHEVAELEIFLKKHLTHTHKTHDLNVLDKTLQQTAMIINFYCQHLQQSSTIASYS